jgi:hypothetical protein
MTDERIERPGHPAAVSRRSFLTQGAGLGLGLGLPPLLAGCGGGDGSPWATFASGLGTSQDRHTATLFFNLSHEDHAGRTYYLTGGGQRLVLTPVADQPQVLQRARLTNAFLRAVADDQITHHVESASFANALTTVCYVSTDIGDPASGTWSMSSVQLYIPPAAAARAFAAARAAKPGGPLGLSAKRRRYGVPAARTAQDLSDERVLLDAFSQAGTMVGFQPDLMSLDAGAAHTIHSNHIDLDVNVYNLGLMLQSPQYGPALPQQPGGQPTGWATLVPVLGDNGVPLRNKSGQHAGRIQYLPSLNPDLAPLAKAGAFSQTPFVKDDVSLGMDATPLVPGEPLDLRLTGTMWMRHDGQTSVDQSPGQGAAPPGAIKMTLKQQNAQVAFKVAASAAPSGAGTQVTLSFTNWFLEFRGVWLQFLQAGSVLTLADLAEYESGSIISGHDKQGDTQTEMFASVVGPAFTVLAIPVLPGTFQIVLNVPQKADTVRVLSSTLSFQGGNAYPDTVAPGAVMTGIVNYGLTSMLAAVGAGNLVPAMYKVVVVPVAQALSLELIKLLSDAINNGAPISQQLDSAKFWEQQALILAKVLITRVATENVKALVEFVVGAITAAAAEDSIPVVGQIMQAISVAVGVATVLETDVALAVAPWTYVDELVFTHDLKVAILRADGDPTFPDGATRYTVTAMFDSGTPYVQSFDLQQHPLNPPGGPLSVVFNNVPLGGNVNVSVAFVRESTLPGMPDILLGKGSTGAIANDVTAAPTIRIQQIRFPINANTKYQHQQKTTLDINGNHLWATAAAPTANASNTTCGGAGTVCGFRSITVRQGTGSAAPSYLGYAWESQNLDPRIAPSCIGGVAGQLDQVANLNADGGNAQSGYANGGCGDGGHGVRVAYSLLAKGTMNFYLDTTNPAVPMVRQVLLDQPQPAFVRSGQAWGALNFASDGLLLHPAGFLVSISRARHQIETLRIPPAALSDADARQKALAQVQSGKGSRPGLINEPVAAAISSDGVILVLEAGNNRIQAFDLGGNPVRHFPAQTGGGASPYSLTLGGTDPTQSEYLDLAVEYTGYLYVLSYNRNSFSYRLDIYHPHQAGNQPICTTSGVNAARLTVDYWRNVYTLNYELLTLPNNTPAGLTEPSVSLWIPT